MCAFSRSLLINIFQVLAKWWQITSLLLHLGSVEFGAKSPFFNCTNFWQNCAFMFTSGNFSKANRPATIGIALLRFQFADILWPIPRSICSCFSSYCFCEGDEIDISTLTKLIGAAHILDQKFCIKPLLNIRYVQHTLWHTGRTSITHRRAPKREIKITLL